MINNLGKWFYVSDPKEAARPSTYEMLRVVRIREPYDGKVACDTETNIKMATGENAIGPTVDKDYLLKHYTAISPQLVAYHVTFEDAPAFHSLYIVFEPYDLEDKQAVGIAVDVYPSLSSRTVLGGYYYTFACHKRRDVVEYFRDLRGYRDYEVGTSLGALYYNDTPSMMLDMALYDWCKDKGGWYNTTRRLMENRTSFATQAKMPIDPEMYTDTQLALSCLKIQLDRMHRHFLSLIDVTNNEINALRGFVQDHDLNKNDCVMALAKIMTWESRDEILSDEVFQRSLIVMPYSMKMDLENIKTNNPLYNLVLAKTTDPPMETYIIMYRLAPVEFRSPNQTGFSQDEIAKLLR